MLSVSIIIPAYNTADTLAAALDAILAQTYPHWEAIVVDDGSTDETGAIADAFAQRDDRVRVIHQSNARVCAARNTGIQAAKFDWLLFNDADDWLAPTCLEKLTAVLGTDAALDVIHCGWTRVTQTGKTVTPKYAPDLVDMFPAFGHYCVFQLNACIIRKAAVEAVGQFDPEFIHCADWDLLQRIARVGGRFAGVPEVLSFYRMQPNSLSSHVERLYRFGLRLLQTTHGIDPRIVHLHPDHELGLPAETLTTHQLWFATWCAGVLLGQGKDARSLLDVIEITSPVWLEPIWIADCLFESIPISTSQDFSQWGDLWEKHSSQIGQFLQALEARTQIQNLANCAIYHLKQKILDHCATAFPLDADRAPEVSAPDCVAPDAFASGGWRLSESSLIQTITLDIAQPISEIVAARNTNQLHCFVTIAGENIGELWLPILDKKVSALALADVVAGEYFWWILARFFRGHVYAPEEMEKHDEIGWVYFLRELFEQPDRDNAWFYQTEDDADGTMPPLYLEQPICTLEISQDLPPLQLNAQCEAERISVILTVGGKPIGIIPVPLENHAVSVAMLRSTLLSASSIELCRVCVREAILGQPLQTGLGLRSRLQAAASQALGPIDPNSLPPLGSCWLPQRTSRFA
jgi:GT2 family glycosyltransferase